ncbi:hypothetical protein GCM10010960_15080 [Arenimonas maotaiensis]|uniref:DUF2946 domain-containing protein n=2 Tax=Arenimonas maotaiensis TaxID=1446479 RepID=A0A917CPC3_9GAMM|nr:hypothetical protein GCM10010960_15080 [Arenimonas maotaiensis]
MPLIRAMALFTALLLACAPGISRLLAHAGESNGWVELCTSEGLRWVALAADEAQTPADPSHHADADCGYCPLSTGTAPPPPLPVAALVHPDDSRPAIAYRAPTSSRTPQSSLGSRGPPTA